MSSGKAVEKLDRSLAQFGITLHDPQVEDGKSSDEKWKYSGISISTHVPCNDGHKCPRNNKSPK